MCSGSSSEWEPMRESVWVSGGSLQLGRLLEISTFWSEMAQRLADILGEWDLEGFFEQIIHDPVGMGWVSLLCLKMSKYAIFSMFEGWNWSEINMRSYFTLLFLKYFGLYKRISRCQTCNGGPFDTYCRNNYHIQCPSANYMKGWGKDTSLDKFNLHPV